MGNHQQQQISSMLMLVAATMLICTISISEAQSTPPSCASKLVPCANYLNTTKPPASCCTPLKEAIENELTCLCTLYNTPGLLTSFGINITQAIDLPKHCNINGDLAACINATSPTSPVPAGVPGNDENGSGRIAWTGFSSLLLFWASTMVYYGYPRCCSYYPRNIIEKD